MTEPQDKRDKNRVQAIEAAAVLDPRLADLWAAIWADQGHALPIEMVGALLRLAYLTGYQDALTEQERGGLFKELGLPVPDRVTPSRAGRPRSR